MPKMSKLFDQNNMFFAIMGVLFDLIILNVLTLLCCIPIVTAGAAFTAMHSVLWRMVRHEETYVARQFFESFKRNFRQSLLPWLGLLLAAVVLAVDGMLAWSMASMRGPLVACVAFAGLVVIAIAQYFSHCCHATKTPLRCICGTPPNLRSDSFHAPCACW